MPDNKLKQFHDSIKGNPNISGVPEDFNVFQSALKNPSNSKAFFDAISKNQAVSGIPKDYNTFATSLGLVEKKSPNVPMASSGMGVSTAGKGKLPVGVASQKTLESYGVTPVGGKTTAKDIYKGVVTEAKAQGKKIPAVKKDDRNILQKANDVVVETLTSGVTQLASGAAGLIGGTASLMTNKLPDTKQYPFMSNEWIKQKLTQQGEVKDPSWFSNQGIRDNFMKLSNELTKVASIESSLAKGDIGVKNTQKSSIDHLLDGNYKDAAKSALVDIGTQIPMLTAMVASGGSTASFAAMGATSAGSELNRQYQQDGDINTTDMVQGINAGIVEAVAGKVFNLELKAGGQIMAKVDDMLGPAGQQLRSKIQSEGVDKVTSELVRNMSDVIKQGTKGFTQEWFEENIVSTTNYLARALDEDVFNKEEFGNFVKELGNNALVAGPLGGGMSTMAAAVSMKPLTSEEKVKIGKYTEILNNESASKEVKNIARQKIDELQKGVNSGSEELFDNIMKLPVVERVETVEKLNRINKLEKEANSAMDVEIKDSISGRISELRAEIENTLASSFEQEQTPTSEVVEPTENDKAITQALSSPEETVNALNSAKTFQSGKIKELLTPSIGETASLYDKNGSVVESGVELKEIDVENNKATIIGKNGKEKKVPLSLVNKTIEQVAQEFHSGQIAPELITEIVTNDISDPNINQQRRMSAKVTGVGQKNLINSAPEWVQNLYKKFISAGDRNTLRALETKESILADKRDKLGAVSKKITNLLKKDPNLRNDANTVLSQDYIDDKIDSFTNKKTDEAISQLTGVDIGELRNAYENPNTEESQLLLKEVNDNLKSQTEGGSKKEVDALIYGEVTKDKEVVRDLATKWVNVGKENNTAASRKQARAEIEDQLSQLSNGKQIIETLKSSRLATINAKRALIKTKPGKELLSTINESRDMIDEFTNWVEGNLAALKIKDKGIGESIINNSGLYIKKTYDYWTDKEFTLDEKLGKQAVESIKRAMLPQRLSALASTKKFESSSESERAEMVKKLEDKAASDASNIFTNYVADITAKKEYKPSNIKVNEAKVQSKNTWEREFINEEFGKILGKSEDAIDRLHASVMAQAQIQSAAEMGMILEQLSGGDFYNSRQSAIDSMLNSGMSEVEAGVYIGKNYKEVSDKFSPLDGKLIPKEMYDMVYEDLNVAHGALFNWLKAATVLWRMSKTVLNPSGHITNALGGNISIAEQGHLIDSQTINFFMDRFRLMGGSNQISSEAKAIKSKMVDTGLWGSSVSIGEINLLLKYADDLNSGDNTRSQKALVSLKKIFNEKYGGIKRYYSATDDFSKLILFHKKKDVFAKKLYGKPYESLNSKEEAIVDANIAERVKQNMPTSSRIPKFAKALIGSVVVGDFQGFRFGAFTSFANTLGNALGDINKGLSDKSLSKEQKKAYLLDGAKTLSASAAIFSVDKSMAATVAGLSSIALGNMAKGLFDEEEDEDGKPIGTRFDFYQNIKNSFYLPSWSKGQNMIVTSDDGKGNLQLMNLSNTFPNDEAYQLFGSQENLPLINMDGPSGFSSVFSKTISLNAVLNIFNNAIRGYDNWNRPIGDGVVKRSLYVASEFAIPSIKHLHKEAVTYAKNQQGEEPQDYSEIDTREVTTYNYIKGILVNSPQLIKRTFPLKMNQQIYYNLDTFYKEHKTKFDRLSEKEKYERIKELEPVRNAFIEMKKYNVHQKNSLPAYEVFEMAFKGLRGKASEEEKNYILTGEKPFDE